MIEMLRCHLVPLGKRSQHARQGAFTRDFRRCSPSSDGILALADEVIEQQSPKPPRHFSERSVAYWLKAFSHRP